MRAFWTVAVLVLLAAAYAGGYWIEHRRVVAAAQRVATLEGQASALEARVAALDQQLAAANARLRLARLLVRVLALTDVAVEGNYGQARELASAFFDEARGEWARASQPELRAPLEHMLDFRDGVTAGLTRGDPAVLSRLHEIQVALRGALIAPANTR